MRSSYEISRAIFAYLNSVRSGKDISKQDLESAMKSDSGKRYRVEHRTLTDRMIDGRTMKQMPQTSTFTSMLGKAASEGDSYSNPYGRVSLFDWKPGNVNKAFKSLTYNPVGRALALGGFVAGTSYLTEPFVNKMLGEQPKIDPATGRIVYSLPSDRKLNAALFGTGTAALSLLGSYNPEKGWKSLFQKFSSIDKKASMLGEVEAVPLGMAEQAIASSNKLTPWMKNDALQMLNAIPGDQNTPITSTDIINASVNTGISGLRKFPIGRMAVAATADYISTLGFGTLMGMAEPNKLAIPVGLASFGLRAL